MALHVNLYHEVLRAKRQKQYDPLKISFLALLVVAALMATYYFVQLKRTSDARGELSARKAEFDRLTPQAKAAAEKEAELTKNIELADRLTNRMEKRFLWAPVLELVLNALPANVQVTKFSGDTGRDKGGVCQVNIEGIAAGQEPRTVAEETRRAIAASFSTSFPSANATFRSLDESTERVNLNGKPTASAIFTISVTFKPQGEPAPAPKRIAQAN